MRIGVSGFFLDKPHTGSGQYLLYLLRQLREIGQHEYRVLAHRGHPHEAATDPTPRGKGQPGRKPARVLAALAQRGERRLPENIAKLALEQATVPLWSRAEGLDLCHVPYYAPPLLHGCPTVVTIHDVIMLAMPEHQRSRLVRWYNRLIAAAAGRASLVIADSLATKRDIVRFLGIEAGRIRVVYLACDDAMSPVTEAESLLAIRRKYGLGEHFAFYIGGLDRRKNVETLIQASASLPDGWSLAIAGQLRSDNPAIFPDLPATARKAGQERRVRFLGQVPEEDKQALYSATDLFVFPSLYEGFGLTPLEALACGAPVACSNASSLPEVVGEAALLFDPRDVAGLAQLVRRVAEDAALRQDLRRRGPARAREFSWRKTARETLEVYEEVGLAGR